ASLLPWKVNTGHLTETESSDVVGKSLVAQPYSQLDRTDIGGVLHDLSHCQDAKRLMVVNAVPKQYDRTHLAIDWLVRRCQVLLQRGAGRDNLERGSRFVGVTDRAVDPGRGARFSALIGIEGRIVGHRKDFSAVRVHHDNGSSSGVRGRNSI